MSSHAHPRGFLSSPTGRSGCIGLAVCALALTAAFAALAQAKPLASWSWLDLLGEGSLALLATAWCVVVLDSRPGGRVTALLGVGLAALALAAWADALDEMFRLPAAAAWLGALESMLMPSGIVTLAIGLVSWRHEQHVLGEQLGARESGVRDHRQFDRLTRLADATYLRHRIAAEAGSAAPCMVAMFEVGTVFEAQRSHGERAGARLLQSVAQQLLLNLRADDLLCRYAGDRLVVLMPNATPDEGQRRAEHLRRMAAATHVYLAGRSEPVRLQIGCACEPGSSDAQATLSSLGRRFDPAAATPCAV